MNPDFSDMLSALFGEGVEFLVVGAYAMAVHGVPRATGDIDLWVNPSPENATRVLNALARFGAPLHDLSSADLEREGAVFQVGVAPRRIDILTGIDGVAFGEAWAHRISTEVGGVRIPVIGLEDLIKNKLATGRDRDRADARRLQGHD